MSKGKIDYSESAGAECWFDGTFKDGKWDTGKYKKGTATYEGSFQDQTMNGKYKVTWNSGIVYNGLIRENKLNGEGVMNFPKGSGNIDSIKGVWNDDTLESSSLITMKEVTDATNKVVKPKMTATNY